MGYKLPAGGSLAIASTYGTAKTMSAISNASAAVATLEASHGVTVGDYVEIRSGWELLDYRIARVSAVATNDVTLEGINTASTTKYPAGEGAGTVRVISAFTTISQVASLTPAGGEQQYADASGVFGRSDKQIPSTRSAVTMEISVHDDPSLAFYAVVQAAEDAGTPVGLRVLSSDASRVLHNGYVTMGKTPSMTRGETDKISISFAAVAEPTRYAD